MVVSIFTCLVYFLNSLDDLASDELVQRIGLARKLEFRTARDLLEEYTFWDEAFQKIIIEHDVHWVEHNSGGYLMREQDYDFSVAVSEGNQEVYLVKSPDAKNINYRDIEHPLIELMDISQQLDTKTKLTNGIFRINGELYHIVGGPFISEVTKRQHKGTYLAVGKRIDSDYLSILENDYQLFGLNVSSTAERLENYLTLYSPKGDVVGYVSWKPHYPSKTIVPAITLITILFAFIITAVTTYILKKEQMSREEYESQLFVEATTDSLTKVKNRRYFMMMGGNEFNTCQLRDEKLLSVLVMDIDNFKQINDQFGHGVGDKALTHFSQLCRSGLRQSDILGRIGGEEFAIILPLTNTKKSVEIANRIRILIEKSPCLSSGKLVNLTVSIGVSSYREQVNFETLLDEADKALYEAKHKGRNRVITYSDDMRTFT
ncbi:sensor domain-containing diguanylate cyclase [Vibrio sp. YIC-376]|uniref:sensor domain-containing diguanylate cyclase n=1 Tax=Vibrio sp. YIC-376 TaxID=3136162 RepID=UPI00402ACE25